MSWKLFAPGNFGKTVRSGAFDLSEAQSFQNQFLIALQGLAGDYFQNSMTLLVDHNELGAFGLMVNRPLEHGLHDIFPELPKHVQCPLLEGGPVEQDKLFFLHSSSLTFESTFVIGADIAITTSEDLIEKLHQGDMPEPLLAILGYSGWGAAQLEEELGENIWLLTPVDPDIIFNAEPEQRASLAARQLGVDLNLIAPRAGHD
ncbi:MAG: putative transcriptional regulator [Candidatus Azotimanducaceae bacterium]|jgi:putative transcriptional regulator